jgi:hypothetical protein
MAVPQEMFLMMPRSGGDLPFVLPLGGRVMLPGIANVGLTATLCPSTAVPVVAVDGLVQVPCPHQDGGGQHLVHIKRCDEIYPGYYRLAVEGEPPTDVDEVVKGEAIAVYTQRATIIWTVVAIE